ncbi:histidine phosphatase family protein [Planktotalea sp.]|uniref:histidine phosphatase family protein n=1 Tax=Planktotalea sp. TaxID=2029877 RepID=UPI003F6D147A
MFRTLVVLLFLPTIIWANDWDALREPGAFALMRHALAPGTSDPANFRLNACETQRNLDTRGQQQARKIGEAFRDHGIEFDEVWTSQWCRTRETAQLLDVGRVVDRPALNSFFKDFSTREAQTSEVIDFLKVTQNKVLIVSHQVNIRAFTGQSTRSGEALVVRLTGDNLEVIGSILINP